TALEQTLNSIGRFETAECAPEERWNSFKLRDILLTQAAVLTCAADMNTSRGSAIYTDPNGTLRPGLDGLFRFSANEVDADRIQQIKYTDGKFSILWRSVRPIPDDGDFFENVWRSYRENKNIF
ncbi:MAG: oxidoreductase, partial [Clostridia bacterium]|nr:oxidoreductase [Clostridia bacterium]